MIVSEQDLESVGISDSQIQQLKQLIEKRDKEREMKFLDDFQLWKQLTLEERGPNGNGRKQFPNWVMLDAYMKMGK